MAFEIEKYTEQYPDKPLTNFPIKEDVFDRMTDVSASLASLVEQYNTLYNAGDFTAAQELLKNNKDLLNCFFNADKYNQLLDAVTAVQRFVLNELERLVNEVAKNTVGIEDEPTEEQKSAVAYSAEKIDELINGLNGDISTLIASYHTTFEVSLPLSGWSNAFPFTNTININGVSSNMDLRIVGVKYPTSATQDQCKKIQKSVGFLISNDTGVGDKQIVFKAMKRPVIDFTIILEGGAK